MIHALRDQRFFKRLSELGPASDALWLLGTTIGLGSALIAAFLGPGVVWAYAGLLVRVSLYLWARDGLRGRGGEVFSCLLFFGLVAGAFELPIDYALVHAVSSGRLVYTSGADVVLLASPIYMPVAWACVVVELGYPALRLFGAWRHFGETKAAVGASLLIGVSAGITVGAYEYLAAAAGWWRYESAHVMLGKYCALFIPLGEFLMFLPILPIAARALRDEEQPVASALEAGAAFAACIAAGYALGYLLLEYR